MSWLDSIQKSNDYETSKSLRLQKSGLNTKINMQQPRSAQFIEHHPDLRSIVGAAAKIELLLEAEDGKDCFHEACVYHPDTRSIFVTSNQLQNDDNNKSPHTSDKHVKLYQIHDHDKPYANQVVFDEHDVAMLNGGVNYDKDTLLFCAQGSKDSSHLDGIVALKIPTSEGVYSKPEVLVSSFHGIPFNSVNDVIVHPRDSSIWFTDPCYGHGQGIRNAPQLPNQVYRFDPKTNSIRAVADGFVRPNGLCFSPDLQTLYITDTGMIHGSPEVPHDPARPSSIYAFDVMTTKSGGTFLTNRRLFAFAAGRIPDGIKCDTEGNVYSGCGNGISIWNPDGDLLGVLAIPGGVANFCFGEKGVIYACNETKFWKIILDQSRVRGALLGI